MNTNGLLPPSPSKCESRTADVDTTQLAHSYLYIRDRESVKKVGRDRESVKKVGEASKPLPPARKTEVAEVAEVEEVAEVGASQNLG